MSYRLYYHPSVKDDIAGIPKNIKKRLKKAIEDRLLQDPLHYGDPLRKSLAGYRKLKHYLQI
jgi:mRNA interferase RelE/StbE